MPRTRKRNSDSADIITDFMSELKTKTYVSMSQRGEQEGIWETEPIDIDTFVTSTDYLGQNLYGLSEPQKNVLEYADDFENGINYIVLWAGKGSGKDWITRMVFMRLAYKLLCMRSPHRYLGLPEQEFITFLNVAASSDQAKSAFFEPLKEYFRSAGENAFKVFGFDPEHHIRDREILLPKNINIVSGHSEFDSLEGKHLLVAVADEIDGNAFKKPAQMWTMLRSSSRSRFSGKEKVFAISYSRYGDSNGSIERLYNLYKAVPNARALKHPTWEFNPNPQVTRESFETEYQQNPEEAECIYGCNPPASALDAFIKDKDRVMSSMDKSDSRHPMVFPLPPENYALYPMTEFERVIDGVEYRLDPYNIEFKKSFVGKPGVEYMFVGDPGLGSVQNGGDAYGICLGHRELVYDDQGKKMMRPVVDFVFRFTGYMFKEREIQFDAIKRLIIQLKEVLGFDITMFSFDQWNSIDLVQWLRRRYGSSTYINKERKYVKYEDFTLLRQRIFGEAPPSSGVGERMNNGGLSYYYHPILFDEIIGLTEDRSKNKIDHTDTSSKDMVDPLASFLYHCVYKWPHKGVSVSAGKLDDTLKRVGNKSTDVSKDGTIVESELDGMLRGLERLARDLRAPPDHERGY